MPPRRAFSIRRTPRSEPPMPLATPLRVRLLAATSLAVFAFVPSAFAAGVGDLHVTSDASNLVRAYDGGSGLFGGVFCSSAGASGQLAIHFGTTNGRVLVGHFGGGVEERDASTGAYLQTFAPAGG